MTTSILKSDDLKAVDRTIRAGFLSAYNAKETYNPLWPLVATRQTSESRENLYPLAIDAAQIREWSEGERVKNGLVIESARVANKKFELTYAVSRDDLEDDMSGAVRQLVSRLRSGAGKFRRHPDRLMSSVLINNTTALDGVALFSASHKVNPTDPASASYANTDTGALTLANVVAARAAMLEVKGADGDPVNEDPKVLMVPPALEGTARKIAGADRIIYSGSGTDSNESNVWLGTFMVVVNPYLSAAHGGSDTAWYLTDTSDPEDRGLIYQVRQDVEITTRFNPADPGVFDLDVYTWGARVRHTVAAGNPRRIYRRTG